MLEHRIHAGADETGRFYRPLHKHLNNCTKNHTEALTPECVKAGLHRRFEFSLVASLTGRFLFLGWCCGNNFL